MNKMGVPYGENGISKTGSKHPTYYLCTSEYNLRSLLSITMNDEAERELKKIEKKKKKYVLGFDGKFMGCFGRIFPKTTISIITKVLKSSKLEMFSDTFDYKK